VHATCNTCYSELQGLNEHYQGLNEQCFPSLGPGDPHYGWIHVMQVSFLVNTLTDCAECDWHKYRARAAHQ
jgi:hypothetical protein